MVTLCNLLFHAKSTLNSDQLAQDFSSWILKISKDRNAKILLGILSQCLTVLISLLWIGGSNLCFHSPTEHLSMKTGSIFPIISSGKLKLPLYPPKPTADGIQHSIFRPSYFVTEDKPTDQAWFILVQLALPSLHLFFLMPQVASSMILPQKEGMRLTSL